MAYVSHTFVAEDAHKTHQPRFVRVACPGRSNSSTTALDQQRQDILLKIRDKFDELKCWRDIRM